MTSGGDLLRSDGSVEAVILDMGGVITTSPFPLMNAYGDEAGLPPGQGVGKVVGTASELRRVDTPGVSG